MSKARLEAFSDGVVAILITIMVLELHAPHDTTWEAFKQLTPTFLTYLLSFVLVGIYWNSHHHLLHAANHISGSVMWANHHLLFWLSLVPFGTAWMGEDHRASLPTAVYGGVLLGAAMAYTLLQYRIIATDGPHSRLKQMIGRDWKGKASGILTALTIPLAFVDTLLSQAIFIVVGCLWFLPDRRIETSLHTS